MWAALGVPLETVINTFNEGATPEEVVMQYPALSLANVYQVIGYYLEHRQEIDAYIEQAQTHNAQVRRDNESRFSTVGPARKIVGPTQAGVTSRAAAAG